MTADPREALAREWLATRLGWFNADVLYDDLLAAGWSPPGATPGWRPIGEHDGGPDLVDVWVAPPGQPGRRMTCCAWGAGQWWYDPGYKPPFPIGNHVTHFMPLPAPPAPEQADG